MKKRYIVGFLSLLFLFTGKVQAQEISIYSADDIFSETYPEIPGPNELVDMELSSYSFNLNNNYIIWFLNGEKQSSGYGNREFSFTTGDSGETSTVTASIEVGNEVYRKEFRFTPSEVDILWEAIDAYTPPFYKGKPLNLKQAKVRLTAIPETQLISPADAPNLVYYWDKNKKRDQQASGFGKYFYEFTGDPLLQKDEIKLTTNDRRENSFAQKKLVVEGYENSKADLLFYEIDSKGRTLTQRALNDFRSIKGSTIHASFHPLSISTTEDNFTDLFVYWNINNEERAPQDFAKQSEIALSTGGETGSIDIKLKLESIENILQETTEIFKLNFS